MTLSPHPLGRAALVLLLLAGVGGERAVGDGMPVPPPPPGRRADAALALLRYHEDLCAGIAARVATRWEGLGLSGAEGQAAIRDFVLHDAVSDLATARAAGDYVRELLPAAREEVGLETGAALTRLHELQTALCDAVALPTAPRTDFAARVADLQARIERESQELGTLLVVPERRLREALDPYLVPVQMAGVAAEGELIEYLHSLEPKPHEPTMAERMAAWHAGYRAAVAPAKAALGRFLNARRRGDRAQVGASCRDLAVALAPVLDAPRLFRPPDPAAGALLRDAFVHLQQVASHCTAGRFQQVDEELAAMQRNLATAAQRLGVYGLQP